MAAVRRNFSPEFVNRIDATVTYQPLSTDTLSAILAQQINDLQAHIENRLGSRGFRLTVSEKGRKFLLEEGASTEYGARELKRAVHKQLTQPLAEFVVQGRVKPGGSVRVDYDENGKLAALKGRRVNSLTAADRAPRNTADSMKLRLSLKNNSRRNRTS